MNESGQLIYVIGASGSGKDSVMRYARSRLPDQSSVIFLHRYITRAHDAGNENHIELSQAEFRLRQRQNLFALDWASHGNCYGIGRELNYMLDDGLTVVVNGSRAYLAEVERRYSKVLQIVLIDAPEAVLKARLQRRSRSSDGSVDARIERSSTIKFESNQSMKVIDNSAEISVAGEQFLSLLKRNG